MVTVNLSTVTSAVTAPNVLELDFGSTTERRRDPTPLKFKQDALALSWASYWITKRNPNRRWVDLNDIEAHDHDINMAEETRRHYRDRLMIRALKGTPLTQFQQDLYEVCNNGVLTMGHLGMIYKLPYFYEEDLERARLKDRFACRPDASQRIVPANREHRVLQPASRILKSRRGAETIEYWFEDARHEPVLLSVANNNPLRGMIDGLFERPEFSVTAFFHIQRDREGLGHWHMAEVRLA